MRSNTSSTRRSPNPQTFHLKPSTLKPHSSSLDPQPSGTKHVWRRAVSWEGVAAPLPAMTSPIPNNTCVQYGSNTTPHLGQPHRSSHTSAAIWSACPRFPAGDPATSGVWGAGFRCFGITRSPAASHTPRKEVPHSCEGMFCQSWAESPLPYP